MSHNWGKNGHSPPLELSQRNEIMAASVTFYHADGENVSVNLPATSDQIEWYASEIGHSRVTRRAKLDMARASENEASFHHMMTGNGTKSLLSILKV